MFIYYNYKEYNYQLGVENMRKMMITIASLIIFSMIVGQIVNALATSEQNLVYTEDSNNIVINKSGHTYEDIEKAMNCFNLPFEFKIPKYVQGEMIVKFKDDTPISISHSSDGTLSTGIKSIDDMNNKYKVISCKKIIDDSNSPALSNIFKLTLNKNSELFATAEEYSNDSNVEFAHPNYIVDFYTTQEKIEQDPIPSYIPNDPYFNEQWALDNTGQNGGTPGADIHAPEAWGTTKGSSDVVIAIIDTGVDYNHPDLASNIWSNKNEIPGNGADDDHNGYIDDVRGWNFKDNTNDPMDYFGHGTHCAGIAAAVIDNGVGIAGIAGHCKIMPLEIYTIEDASKAIKYAVDNGADIISMSFGISDWFKTNQSTIFDLYLDWAYHKGVVEIASAGNDNFEIMSSPASNKNVIAVTASDNNDNKAYFSSYGYKSEIAAPGVDIYSTVWQDSPEFGFISNLSVNQEYFESKSFAYTGLGSVSGQLVYVGLGRVYDLQGISLTGKIALIQRGEISFSEKVDNVCNKGAIGAIIFNNEPGNFWGSLGDNKTIPVVSISRDDGEILLNLINQGSVQANLSVTKNPYEWLSGTSMSCPTVAGVAALVLSQNPYLTNEEVRTILRSSTDPINSNVFVGMGRINANQAVNKAKHIVAEFDRSLEFKIIDGVYDIKGTAKGLNFNSYIVQYSTGLYPNENSWITIGGSESRKYGQKLVSWDTRDVPEGPYTLRLEVFSNDNQVYVDRTFIIIDNIAQTFQIDDDYNENTVGWGYDHFNNIQDAITFCGNKDDIFVHSGTYSKNVNIEHRSIKITGEDINTTILKNTSVYAKSGSVQISNFHFNSSGITGMFSSSNNVVENNLFTDEDYYGSIGFLFFSNHNVIRNNTIDNPPKHGLGESGSEIGFGIFTNDNIVSNNYINNGVLFMMGAKRNTISGNHLHDIGFVEACHNNNIINNVITHGHISMHYGITINHGHLNLISNNIISDLDSDGESPSVGIDIEPDFGYAALVGSRIGDSYLNEISNNDISNCDIGIAQLPYYLSDSIGFCTKQSTIKENTISECGVGIYLLGSPENSIYKNVIQNNELGIKIKNYVEGENQLKADDNKIYLNDFIDNNQQAYDDCSNTWYLSLLQEGNYWSDYTSRYPDAQVVNRILRPDIWSIPYDIDGGANQDMFPLVNQHNNQQSSPQSNPSQDQQISQSQNLISLLKFAIANKISLLSAIQQILKTTSVSSYEAKSSDVSTVVKSDSGDTSTTKITGTSSISDTTSKIGGSDKSGTSDTKTPTDTNSGADKPSISSGGGHSSGNQNVGDNKPTITAN
jgi:parallel beta-helix repeat protein